MHTLFFVAVILFKSACAGQQTFPVIDYNYPNGEPFYGVTSSQPRTWHEMREQCNREHIGYYLPTSFRDFPPEAVALCPSGTLVPFAVVLRDGVYFYDDMGDYENQTLSPDHTDTPNLPQDKNNGAFGALVWPTAELRMIGNETKFTCAVCEMARRLNVVGEGIYPPHDNSVFEYDLELVSYHHIADIGLVADGSDLSNRLLDDLANAFNISDKALRWHGAKLNEDGQAVVHVFYDRGLPDPDWLYYVSWNDQYLEHKSVANFEIRGIKRNTECLKEKTFLTNVRREKFLTGYVNVKTIRLRDDSVLLVSECIWDAVNETAVWTRPITWSRHWTQTTEYPKVAELLPSDEQKYRIALRQHDVTMSIAIDRQVFNGKPVESLKAMNLYVHLLLALHSRQGHIGTVLDLMLYDLPLNTAKMVMKISPTANKTSEIEHTPLTTMLLSELDPNDPVVGLAQSLSDENNNNQNVVTQLNHGNMTEPLNNAHIVVTVSDSIAFSAERLSIATYAAHLDLPNQTKRYDDSIDSWMAMVQVSFMRPEPLLEISDKDFVDIAFKPMFSVETFKGRCAERNFTTDEWFVDNCRVLKSMRNKMLVCRCKNLHPEGNLTSGSYLIYGFDAKFGTYLANNLSLVIVIIVVCFMSALGLLSVIITAVAFPEWRKDQGHKIFLQMILALTVNLVLGFVNNFFSIDTKTVACIAIGVLRHYSFLAMFFWMMVLSGLQVKRLTTIAGAKATTHLILKVSVIAWGLPLIPIVILLAWDTGFYKSEVSNRGYCYPEDVAFQATVQTPVGVILIANLIIFVIILNHIYGWVKCNKDVVVRKHTADDRAAQLRNLGNSIFVFFLFGFTWLFHFLSEEGIINNEFLFEFLFLITASFHLFMLALFFIVLDKKTRTLWGEALGTRAKGSYVSKMLKNSILSTQATK